MTTLKERTQVRNDFAENIKLWTQQRRNDYPHPNDGDAFAHWALEYILPDIDSDAAFALLDISGKDDLGIDACYKDEQDGVYYLFQSKSADRPRGVDRSPSFSVSVVRELFSAHQLLLNTGAIERLNPKLLPIALDFQASIKKGYEVRFCFILYGWLSTTGHKELEERLRLTGLDKASSEVYDLDELYNLYLQAEGPQALEESLFVPFSSCFDFSGSGPRALVANIDLVQFALQIAPHRPAIYSANVRNPLGYNLVNRV